MSKKRKSPLLNAGFLVYCKCGEQAEHIIDRAVADRPMHLIRNNDTDPRRTDLIQKIINLTFEETVNKRMDR